MKKLKFCPDKQCQCLVCTKTDKSNWEFGTSYECIGKVKQNIYIAGKTKHENNLSHCIWSVNNSNPSAHPSVQKHKINKRSIKNQ